MFYTFIHKSYPEILKQIKLNNSIDLISKILIVYVTNNNIYQ